MIYVAEQKPHYERYTKAWYGMFQKYSGFKTLGDGKCSKIDRNKDYNYFANLEESVSYEVDILGKLFNSATKIDKLLVCDLSFPGIIATSIPTLKLKFPNLKIYGILHGGSWNKGDIYGGSRIKKTLEWAAIEQCEKVFVATNYHKEKIECYFTKLYDKIVVLGGMPLDKKNVLSYQKATKKNKILILGRGEQTDMIAEQLRYPVDIHTHLVPRHKYLELLSEYKIVISPKQEETYGYGVIEATLLGCYTLAPNKCSYPEVLDGKQLYNNIEELNIKIDSIINNKIKVEDIELDVMAETKFIHKIKEIII